MIAFSALLLMAGAQEVVPPPAIRIDPCVEVDAEEVRRLAAIELSNWQPRSSSGPLEVVVACSGGVQELRVSTARSGKVTVRSIDLGTPPTEESGEPRADDRDAKARELALAIAELLRRIDVEATEAAPPVALVAPAPKPSAEPARAADRPEPFRSELGLAGVAVFWTGGEMLFGADLTGRGHVARFLIAELRLGGRKTRPLELESGSLDGHGMAAAAGLALDATPGSKQAGVSFGARIGVDWLRYAAHDRPDTTFTGKDAAGVNLAGTATGFMMLSNPWCITVDVSVGTALHSIVINENERELSGLRGVFLSSAVALGAHF